MRDIMQGKSTRKYRCEFGIHSFCTFYAMLQQDQLKEIPDEFPDTHIYLIGRRPRIMLDEKINATADTVDGRYAVICGEHKDFHAFSVPNGMGTGDIRISCPYPYTHFQILDHNGKICSHGMTSLLVSQFIGVTPSHFDLEIIYVGQAFGKDGSRCSPQRLSNHSKLQEIYLHAMQRTPDQEIWIVLCKFEQQLLQSVDPNAPCINRTDEEENEHIQQTIIQFPLSEQVKTNFTEAALIKYFQPEYNTQFRELFPSPSHQSYATCYNMDVNLVSLELSSENLKCRLWSPAARACWTHFARYPLHSTDERREMFHFAGWEPLP